MKTQNMKLLDLQTGEYLELGKEGFFYGGKTITCPPTKSFDIQNVDRDMTLHIYADTEKDYDIKCLDDSHSPLFEITLKSNNQKLIGREVGHIDMRFNRVIKQTEPPLELKEICKKVGAVVYGGRYILERNTMCEYNIIYKITYADCIIAQIPRNFEYDQHIGSDVIKSEPQYFSDKFICKEKDYLQTIKRLHKIEDDTRIEILQVNNRNNRREVDILKEYLKQLRNEPNKFDELKQYLK
jgi:hypothetical protein